MISDQVAQTRRPLKQMNDAADRAIDRSLRRSQVGSKILRRPQLLKEMNDAADRAI
jgi:hypothetical protein